MQIDHLVANASDRSVPKRHCLIESTDPDSQNATGIAGVFNDRVPIAESAVNGQHQWSKHERSVLIMSERPHTPLKRPQREHPLPRSGVSTIRGRARPFRVGSELLVSQALARFGTDLLKSRFAIPGRYSAKFTGALLSLERAGTGLGME
jgi:hypothetical protein